MEKDKRYLKNIFLSLFVTAFIILMLSMSYFQVRDKYFGEFYTIDASCEETVETFLNLRDSLSEDSDTRDHPDSFIKENNELINKDSINKEIKIDGMYYSIYMDSVRNEAIHRDYSYNDTFITYLPIRFDGEKRWVKILIYPDDDNNTIVDLCSIGDWDYFANKYSYINSNSLGFINSFKISRVFEKDILSNIKLKWSNTTPIGNRLGPLYLWVYHIWGREARSTY